jgi:hypothetical protein
VVKVDGNESKAVNLDTHLLKPVLEEFCDKFVGTAQCAHCDHAMLFVRNP